MTAEDVAKGTIAVAIDGCRQFAAGDRNGCFIKEEF